MRRYIAKKVLKRTLLFLCFVVLVAAGDSWQTSSFLLTEKRLQLPNMDECQIFIYDFKNSSSGLFPKITITKQTEKQILYDFAQSLRFTLPTIPLGSEGAWIGTYSSDGHFIIEYGNTIYWIGFDASNLLKFVDDNVYKSPHFGQPLYVLRDDIATDTSSRYGLYATSDEELYNVAYRLAKLAANR